MSGIDWVPGISQGKQALQLITGDTKGAARTAENFARECPVVSQVTSLVQLIDGDEEGAIETQKRCLRTVDDIANKIPVTGYPKSVYHHFSGDHEARNRAFDAATRSTITIGAGVATGGGGAVLAKIGAGMAYDVVTSAVNRDERGTVKKIHYACDDPSAGSIYDATYSVGKPAIKRAVYGSSPWTMII